MTEKKYRVHDWVKFQYSEIGEYVGEGYTDKPLRNDEIVDLLNKFAEENEQLKQQFIVLNDKIEFLETILKETDEDVFYATKKITEQMTLQNKKGEVND